MTKRQALRLLGLRRDSELAAFFKVRRQAVAQWKHLPELRLLQLQARRPDLFAAARKPAKAPQRKTS